jgi:DNA processing protein
VGPVSFRELINRFGGAEAALDVLPDLARRGGRTRPLRLFAAEAAEAELEAAEKIGARPLFTIEPGFPRLLAHIATPPPLLYVKGRLDVVAREGLAIVGSRDASALGRQIARSFATDLGRAGFVVISGLARGIDGEVHTATLETGTIAVLAGGVDQIYPPEHDRLYARVVEAGAVVSEMPPGCVARGPDFPRRNRIISGLSRGVVVVEAAERSGTLTTARWANEQGREVFAIPGHPLDPRAGGTNKLLKDGATLVTSAADVLAVVGPILTRNRLLETSPAFTGIAPAEAAPAPDPSSQGGAVESDEGRVRETVLEALSTAPVAVDQVVRTTGLTARQVSAALLELGLAGRIDRHGQHLVSRRPETARRD